jgi:hypothetical protein
MSKNGRLEGSLKKKWGMMIKIIPITGSILLWL